MAVQARLYPDHIIGGFPAGGPPQDYWTMGNNGVGDVVGRDESCFDVQKKFQPQQHPHSQQQKGNPNLAFQNMFASAKDNRSVNNANQFHHQSMPTTAAAFPSQSIAASLAEEQSKDIDRFIALQNERLRMVLQLQTRQLFAALLRKMESKTAPLLKQKDEEIARAAKKATELEHLLRKLEMESQAWRRAAAESESMVLSLNNSLEELRERASNGADSCCDLNFVGTGEEGTGENMATQEEDDVERREQKMVCQNCNSESSCVMFLPCRHLCSCKACDSFLRFCPICRSAKKASMEVFIF